MAISVATLATLVALIVSFGLAKLIPAPNILLVFLAPVILSAFRFGFWPACYAAFLGVSATSYFFAEPRHSFEVSDPTNIWALFVFFVVAGFTTLLSNQFRVQNNSILAASRLTEQLYGFSQKLAETGTVENLLRTVVEYVHTMLEADSIIFTPLADVGLSARAAVPTTMSFSSADHTEAHRAWVEHEYRHHDTGTLDQTKFRFFPLVTRHGRVGVLGVRRSSERPFSHQELKLLDALSNHAAITVERAVMSERIEEARLTKKAEEFRAALLASLTHDFKTPLASILGSISALRHFGPRYDEATKAELLENAEHEAEHLNRYIVNLLEITRLESGAIRRQIEPADIDDLIGATLKRAEKLLFGYTVLIEIPANLPMAQFDVVLAEQALFNIIDNAVKHGRPGGKVRISARASPASIRVTVEDNGPGIAPEHMSRIFDRFYRVRQADRQKAGIGLGLTVSKGLIEAMDGTLDVRISELGGAAFDISFPVANVAFESETRPR